MSIWFWLGESENKGDSDMSVRSKLRSSDKKVIDGTFHLIRLEKGPDFFLPLDIGQTFLVCN